jgi:cobalt/nickel transport protein
MSTNDKYLVIAGVIICLVIAVLSPFIASSNPDGLEKSAESLASNPEPEPALQSPFPDYTIGGLDKIGEIVALALGIILTLVIAYIVAILLRRRNPPKASK